MQREMAMKQHPSGTGLLSSLATGSRSQFSVASSTEDWNSILLLPAHICHPASLQHKHGTVVQGQVDRFKLLWEPPSLLPGITLKCSKNLCSSLQPGTLKSQSRLQACIFISRFQRPDKTQPIGEAELTLILLAVAFLLSGYLSS